MPEQAFNNVIQRQEALARNAREFLGIPEPAPIPPPPAVERAIAIQDDVWLRAHIGEFQWNPAPPPIPQPAPPIDLPDFQYDIDGVIVIIPGWAKYLAQEKDGRVYAYELEPVKAGNVYCKRGGREKMVLEPEKYDMWAIRID